MSAELERQALDIVFELLDSSPELRTALKEKLCGEDQQLTALVDRLWRSHQKSGEADFLNHGVMEDASPSLLHHSLEDSQHVKPVFNERGRQTPVAGRFIPMEILGHGGQGDVWKAIDPELNREVALKVLGEARRPLVSAAQRFRREATVTGMLEHPNIVPVYEAGKITDDGSPYYVMRILKNRNLQSAIEDFHVNADSDGAYLNGLRSLLSRFLDVCDAVAYAHSKGVIHRDLKPANIMLGDFGETLVVDWGLAKVLSQTTTMGSQDRRPLEDSDIEDTIDGTITGSPRFMSPEQARGEIAQLTEATDIYSLGAILFVILTGKPAISQSVSSVANRASAALTIEEILRRVSTGQIEEPRKINPRVPKALEAVCLKALSLNPEDRYKTAASQPQKGSSLAGDIRRWLNDEPVQVYRDPPQVRFRRWAKRHRTLVASSVASLLVATAGLGALAMVVNSKNRELILANDNERNAREIAREDRQAALDVIKDIVFKVDPILRNQKGSGQVRREVLRKLPELMDRIAEHSETIGDTDRTELYTLLTAASVIAQMGGDAESSRSQLESEASPDTNWMQNVERLQHRALSVAEDILKRTPADAIAIRDKMLVMNALGDTQRIRGNIEKARSIFSQSLQIAKQLLDQTAPEQDVTSVRDLALVHERLGNIDERLGNDGSALSHFRIQRELIEPLIVGMSVGDPTQRDFAIALGQIAKIKLRMRELNEAESLLVESNRIREARAAALPDDFQAQRDVADGSLTLGQLLLQRNRLDEANSQIQLSVTVLRKLTAENPGDLELGRSLATALQNLADLLVRRRKAIEAEKVYQECIGLRTEFVTRAPQNTQLQRELFAATINFCDLLFLVKKDAMAVELLQEGYSRAAEMSKDSGDVALLRSTMLFCNRLGQAYSSLDQHDLSEKWFKAGLDRSEQIAARFPDTREALRDVSIASSNMGDVCLKTGRLELADVFYTKAVTHNRKFSSIRDPETVVDYVASLSRLGSLTALRKNFPEAVRLLREGLAALQKLRDVNDTPALTVNAAKLYHQIGQVNLESRNFEEAHAAFISALELMNKLSESGVISPADNKLLLQLPREIQLALNYSIACKPLDELLAQPRDQHSKLLELRALMMADQARFEEAADAAERLMKMETASKVQLYNAGCVFGRCFNAIVPHEVNAGVLSQDNVAQRQKLATMALESLRLSIQAGWSDFDLMRKDSDLSGVRELPEFLELMPQDANGD